MSESLVKIKRQGRVVILSLNRAERHNALIPELLTSLLEALAADDCQNAVVIVLRSEGQSFSTGGDLLAFQQHRDTIGHYASGLVGLLNRVIMALLNHPAVVVCSVQGQVTGGSLGLLLASDRVVMHQDATITPWYSVMGFSPDGGWTAILPHIIGRQQTLSWLNDNTCKDAKTCLGLGLVDEVVASNCDAVALGWANKINSMHAGDIANTTRLSTISIEDVGQRLEAERLAFAEQVQTREALDGIDRFLRRE